MGQGSLVCCSPWGCKESDTTEWLNWTEYWCKMISLLSVVTIWWCPCVKSSLVLLEVVCYDQGVLLAKLLAFSLLHFVLQCQTCLLFQLSLNFLLLHSSLLWWKGHLFFLVLVLEDLVRDPVREPVREPVYLRFFSIRGWGTDLDYCVEWFALETNQDHSVTFEIVPRYCISDSLIDYGSYSISFKGFLPTVVDIMVIWIKFAHSSPF